MAKVLDCDIIVLNSERKKISLTGQVSYMGGMLERNVTTKIAWASRKLYNDWRFSTRGENKGAGRRVNTYHAALGADLVPNSQGLRGKERPELYKTH